MQCFGIKRPINLLIESFDRETFKILENSILSTLLCTETMSGGYYCNFIKQSVLVFVSVGHKLHLLYDLCQLSRTDVKTLFHS